VLGPWAAVIAISIALAIQALFFGDGGTLAYGANAFNMAFVIAVRGLRRVRGADAQPFDHVAPPSAGGGCRRVHRINAAALCTAIEFGLQPRLFHSSNGTPLYAAVPSVANDPGDDARPLARRRRGRGRA